jgi:hypothetical protein
MDGMTKKAWLRSISDLGCIVCLNEYGDQVRPGYPSHPEERQEDR